MKKHELKCWPSVFQAVANGEKTWEFRLNDRDFQVGDVLALVEWDPHKRYAVGPEYRQLKMRVTYIMYGGQFGIPVGYCVMSIVPLHSEGQL